MTSFFPTVTKSLQQCDSLVLTGGPNRHSSINKHPHITAGGMGNILKKKETGNNM